MAKHLPVNSSDCIAGVEENRDHNYCIEAEEVEHHIEVVEERHNLAVETESRIPEARGYRIAEV